MANLPVGTCLRGESIRADRYRRCEDTLRCTSVRPTFAQDHEQPWQWKDSRLAQPPRYEDQRETLKPALPNHGGAGRPESPGHPCRKQASETRPAR